MKTPEQVTPEDFKAPQGKYRIMREDLSDGELSIIGDYCFVDVAKWHLRELVANGRYYDVFTLSDEKGEIDDPLAYLD